MLTLAIGSPKGGVGKTATAVHLAAIAAGLLKLRVLVVDSDMNHSSWDWLKRAKAGSLTGLAYADGTDPDEVRKVRRGKGYDLVVIDLPGAREGAFQAVLEGDDGRPAADYLLMPTAAEVMDLRPVVRVARSEVAKLLPYAIVLCRVETQALPRARERQAELLTSRTPVSVASTIIREYTVMNECVERSLTALDIPGRHSMARRVEDDYRALGAETFGAMGLDVEALRKDVPWLAE